VAAIIAAGFIGFLAGQILAAVLEAIGASIARYPGGLSALSSSAAPPWWANALGLVGVWAGFAAAIVYAYRAGGLAPLVGQWRPRVSDLAFVVVGVAAQLLVDLLYDPFHFRHLNRPVHRLFHASHGASFVLLGLLTTFVAPVFEEWLFRGVLYRAVAEGTSGSRRRRVTLGVVVSAVLFGVAHGEPLQFLGLALLGALLALLVARTHRLVPSYVTHASFNATAFVAVIAQRMGH